MSSAALRPFHRDPSPPYSIRRLKIPPINTSQIGYRAKYKDDSHVKDKDEIRVKDVRETDTQTYAMYTCGHYETRQTEPHELQAELYKKKPHTLPYTVYYMDDDLKTLEERFEDLVQMTWDLNFKVSFIVDEILEMKEA